MIDTFQADNFLVDGKPAGGSVRGTGLIIDWQNGPLGRGTDRQAPNGAFVETVLKAVVQRIEFYNDNGFPCDENYHALDCINNAIRVLNSRTARREAAGTEGTHEGT